MKYRIEVLKAPWPKGAGVGDVIEFVTLPTWAAGKCVPAGDDAEVTTAFGDDDQPTAPQPDKLDELRDAAQAALDRQRQDHLVELQALRAQFDAEVRKGTELQKRFDALTNEFADQRDKLVAADGAAQAARAEAADAAAKLTKAEEALAASEKALADAKAAGNKSKKS